MRRRLVALGLVVIAGVSACADAPAPRADPGGASPAGDLRERSDLNPLSRSALLATKGTPLIDPTELVVGADFDVIPSVDQPVTVSRARADTRLSGTEQVLLVTHGGQARAYPVRSLIRHEIVNDVIAGLPVAVTWCPLCNTGIAFDRRVNGKPEVFGVSGGLYRSALVMFDRRTTSLWPQPLGKAVLGPLLGSELEVLASSLLPWSEIRAAHPDVTVALGSQDELASSTNPYEGYDTSAKPFLFRGDVDGRLPAFTRVAGVTFGSRSTAWSYDLLRRRRVVQATVGGQQLVVLWAPGTASPLEGDDVRAGRDVGSTAVYDPRVSGRSLTFSPTGRAGFRDRETGSRWTLTGMATDGALKGTQLAPLAHQDAFWFAWAAFQPQTALVTQ
ncbi:MAG: DUF3179 domain-containing protein [Actinobacteria bacterium]|nr:DUF3179 domain-containing protein [Actinomycetota bacterium]MCA1721651.1 DUF3179 domain-containing protein [Actinomycetota bacterium]